MKLRKICAGFAAAGALLASLSQPALAAGELQITKVNPGGKAETRAMQIESAGRTMSVAVATTPILTKADVQNVTIINERTKVTSGAKPETRELPAMRFKFTPEGSKKLTALEKEWAGRQIGLVINGKLFATPILNTTDSRELTFSGNFTPEQGRLLVAEINGKSPAPVAEPPPKEKKKP